MRRAIVAAALVAASCGPPGLRKTNANLQLSPATLDFGKRPVLDDLTLKVHLTNYGLAPVDLTQVSLQGDSVFTLVSAPQQVVAGGEGDIAVNFDPQKEQAYSGSLLIDTDEQDRLHLQVPLQGVGSTAACATVTPQSLDFGRVGEGRSKVERVEVCSCGTADLVIKHLDFVEPGTNPAFGFIGSTATPATLAAHVAGQDDACADINVAFAPTAATVGTDMNGTLEIDTTDPANQVVKVPMTATEGEAPIAVINVVGGKTQVAPGTTVTLDGSKSYDPDGGTLISYAWTFVSVPQGSAAKLVPDPSDPNNAARTTFTTDQPGDYEVQLTVTDSDDHLQGVATTTITAVTADKLVIELIWDSPLADLDLHFLQPGGQFDGPMDCFWANPHPAWSSDPSQDPVDLGDKLVGFGPEYVVYDKPLDGSYVIAVNYVSPNGDPNVKTNATVRVYMYGVLVQELDHEMDTPQSSCPSTHPTCSVWTAGTLQWPTGNVTPGGDL